MFNALLQRLLPYKRVINFVLVGGGVAFFGLVQMYFYVDLLNMEHNLAYILQTIISLQLNFTSNDLWTWGDVRQKNGAYWSRWLRFMLSRAVTIGINQVVFTILTFADVHYIIAYLFNNIVIGLVLNYLTSKNYVFRIREPKANDNIKCNHTH
jgi:putative flippase GtrA